MQSYFVKTSFNMIEVKFYITSINHLKPCNFFFYQNSSSVPVALFYLLCLPYSSLYISIRYHPLNFVHQCQFKQVH